VDLKGAANRQFQLGENNILSGGLGLGVRQDSFFELRENALITQRNQQFMSTDAGLACRSKKLSLAASYNHFLGNRLISTSHYRKPYFLAFAAYTFRISENINLTPHACFYAIDGFRPLKLRAMPKLKPNFYGYRFRLRIKRKR